ncbi:MAG: dihydroxyacetone kinase subunit DhaK, partial [Lautropia sp.]
DGIAVEMVIVADDVALAADGDHAGRRGIAGTVLVHKLAGAAAASGAPLAAVKGVAERALGNLATMGVALSPCTVPAAGRPGFTLGDDEIELGLGIHGEAGVRRGRIAPATQLIGELVDATVRGLALQAGDRVALLINNLGATATLELQLVVGEAITQLQSRGIRVVRAWSGAFLTALEMAGVSLSLLRIGDDDDLARLDTATQAPAWPAGSAVVPAEPALLAPPAGSALPAGTVPAAVDTPLTRGLERICAALIAAESELTRLDQAVGDGDLGISLARGARAIRDERGGYPPDLPGTLRALSATLRRALGGTSGPLYAIALLRAAAALPVALPATPGAAPGLADVRALGAALAAAADGIAHVGGASEGDRTMLDALIPAARAWQAVADQGGDTVTALTQAIAAARAGSAATAQQIARRGRSSYLGDRVVGHVDPGALAVCLWLEALARADQGIRQS